MSIYRALHSSMHVNYRKSQPIYNDTEIQISLDFPEALYTKAHLLCNIIMHKLDDCKSTTHQCLTNDPKCSHNIYMVTMLTYIVHVEISQHHY